MKVTDRIRENGFATIIEFLPPMGHRLGRLRSDIGTIQKYADFVSLTSKEGRAGSLFTALMLKKEFEDIDIVPHVTLREWSSSEIVHGMLMGAAMADMDNILVMRGDRLDPEKSAHRCSSQLVEEISGLNNGKCRYRKRISEPTHFNIGVVANQYRESREELTALKQKIDAGAEYVILQMSFDPERDYFPFRERAYDFLGRDDIPIIPSIPIPDKSTIGFVEKKLQGVDAIKIPKGVKRRILSAKDDRAEGIEIAREILCQVRDKAPGVDILSRGSKDLVYEVLRDHVKEKTPGDHTPSRTSKDLVFEVI
ncbi:methylenetetrahydrofolate reductase [bacterium]|nr:methylenetetrahydrofolate reductase [bacterium]